MPLLNTVAPRRQATIDRLTDVLVRYRWLFVVPVLLPLSTLFDLVWAARNFCRQTLRRAPERHDARVRAIQRQIRDWRAKGAKGRLCTARPNWMSISTRFVTYKRPENSIRIDLHDILELDIARRVVRVEPGVTIGQLIAYLVPRGWTIPVVPELKDLTVGGLYVGFGIEVSSHKHGLFSESVRSCDVVLGDGRLVTASPSEKGDLFNALPWSQGSLGFVVSLDIAILPARPYVHLTYHPVRSLEEAAATMAREIGRDEPAEFVEGLIFSAEEGVVTTGVFADSASGKIHRASRWYAPWFAARSRRFIAAGGGSEFIPLIDYYQRHVRGMYWETELIVPFGNHPLFRWLLGWMMPPKIAFLRLTQGARIRRYYDEKHVIQDAIVPVRYLEKTLRYFDRLFEGYPLWMCPTRIDRKDPAGFLSPSSDAAATEMYVDVAVISVPGPVLRGEAYNALDATRAMEAYLIEHGGYQGLYAVTQLTAMEFRRMFDSTLYDQVRERYGAEDVFMDVHDKVRRVASDRERPSGH